MVSWRPIQGRVELLDPSLTSLTEVQDFFSEYRILGRGEASSATTFRFELAVGGRRRRVATLDENDTVFLGYSVHDLLEEMSGRFRKVELELGGEILHGPFDLGAVGIDEADFVAPESMSEEAGQTVEQNLLQNSAEDAQQDMENAKEVTCLPVLAFGDFPLSEISVLATRYNADIAALKVKSVNALVSTKGIHFRSSVFPRPNYALEIFFTDTQLEKPQLLVTRDNFQLAWNWEGQLAPFTWTDESQIAQNFVIEELGAGAVARRAVADVVDVSFSQIRQALLAPAALGVSQLVQALGLPEEVRQVLAGQAEVESIPGARLFVPQSASKAFAQAVAFEVAGEGMLESDVAKAYRKVYLHRPWLVSAVAVLQGSLGAGLLAYGVLAATSKRKRHWSVGLGIGLLLNAGSRILTTRYVRTVLAEAGMAESEER